MVVVVDCRRNIRLFLVEDVTPEVAAAAGSSAIAAVFFFPFFRFFVDFVVDFVFDVLVGSEEDVVAAL